MATIQQHAKTATTCVTMTDEDLYEQLKTDFKAVHGREAKVLDLVQGLDAVIKGKSSDAAFAFLSAKKASELKSLFFDHKVEIVEKVTAVEKAKAPTPEEVAAKAAAEAEEKAKLEAEAKGKAGK